MPVISLQWDTFPSELGWFSLVVSQWKVHSLQFGFESADAAESSFAQNENFSDCSYFNQQVENCWIAALIIKLQRYASGAAEEF